MNDEVCVCECGVTSDVVDVFSGERASRAIRPHDGFFLHARFMMMNFPRVKRWVKRFKGHTSTYLS